MPRRETLLPDLKSSTPTRKPKPKQDAYLEGIGKRNKGDSIRDLPEDDREKPAPKQKVGFKEIAVTMTFTKETPGALQYSSGEAGKDTVAGIYLRKSAYPNGKWPKRITVTVTPG